MKNIKADLRALKEQYDVSFLMSILSNRGFHSLLFYRMAHWFYRLKVPLMPLILTRIIQIFYAIDIDYRANIDGGVVLVHGVGSVIGSGACIGSGTIIYHQVTIGVKGYGDNDGFATVGHNCILGAGAKILGKVRIGDHCVIGANSVITHDVPDNSVAITSATVCIKERRC